METVGELEGQGRVVDVLEPHLLDVLARRHLVGVLLVVRDPAAGDDGAQVQVLAQFLAGVVQTPAEPEAPVARMYEHLDPVQDVAFGIMGAEVVVAGDFPERVLVGELGVVDDDRQRGGHDLAVDLHAELALREDLQEPRDGIVGPVVAPDSCVGFDHGPP